MFTLFIDHCTCILHHLFLFSHYMTYLFLVLPLQDFFLQEMVFMPFMWGTNPSGGSIIFLCLQFSSYCMTAAC